MPESTSHTQALLSSTTNPPAHTPARRAGDRHLLESEPLETLDRQLNANLARLTMGVSPIAFAMDYLDWAVHLAASPGKRLQLAHKAVDKAVRFSSYAMRSMLNPQTPPCIEPLPGDRRFTHKGWQSFPFNLIHQAFLLQQQWWHNATTGIRGVSKHDEESVSFITRQLLDMISPSNVPFLNPEIIEATVAHRGSNLVRGAEFLVDDLVREASGDMPAGAEAFTVGKDVAVTPGKVVFRNHLIELIQYAPTTERVQREPVLLQSAWMMKYYIMDLSPHNSLVRYLVERGHTVFAISWLNPGPEDRDLGMEDYRRLGTMAALDAVAAILPDRKIHAVGYCLGGTLLTIAAAAMLRDGDARLATLTLFTTLTDFSEAGELTIFMDPSEVAFLEDMMWQRGYLDRKYTREMFRMIRSRDLIWSKLIRENFLGQREELFDLMAWNADGTRMAYRQHSELLRRLYHDNELFQGKYFAAGHPVHLGDIRVPIFCVATERDHVAPWRSVYKLNLQTDGTDLTFVLTNGGHNVGIVNEPGGSARRRYQMATAKKGSFGVGPDAWKAQAPGFEGSWWPAWETWLSTHSAGNETPPPMGAPDKGYAPLCDAPGTYVLQT